MNKLMITISVEWQKIRKLELTYVALILGAIIPIVKFVPSLFHDVAVVEGEISYSIFESSISQNIGNFVLFILFIYIIIAASRIAQVDHKNNCWQLIETQPVSRFQIYIAKYVILLFLSLWCITSYFISNMMFSLLDYFVHPDPAKLLSIDIIWMLKTYLKVFVTILGIAALQLCLAVILSGFLWSFLIGILGLILNLYFLNAGEHFLYSPYNSLSFFKASGDIRGLEHFISFSEHVSVFWAIVFLVLGYFWYSRKGFKNAFMKNKSKILVSAVSLVIFSGIFFILKKPKSYTSKGVGVTVKGSIKATFAVDSMHVYSEEFHKKLGVVPIKNNQFSWTTLEKLPLDTYILEFGGKKLSIFMGNGDVVDLNIQCNETEQKIFLKSNRKAEPFYQTKLEYDNGLESFGYNFYSVLDRENPTNDPTEFYKVAQEDWIDNLKKIDNYIDPENEGLSDEYKEYRKQLLAIRYLAEIDKYKKLSPLSIVDKVDSKEFVDELNKYAQKPGRLLSKDDIYLQYRLDQLLTAKESVSNRDSILFVKLDQLPKGIDKDRLLTKHLGQNIELKTDSTSRNHIFTSQINKIENKDYKNMLYSRLKQINLSQKGAPFPDLLLMDERGSEVKLSKYKDKYVVIDLWATWCSPCRKVRPIFDTRSFQYAYNSEIQFISISIDGNKSKWMNYLKTTPSHIPQYWLPNAEKFMNQYKIEGIPRFIIIDPKGKIFNLNTPFPSDDNFVDILDKLKKY
ncbi:thioredoxin [Chryseobacterium nematophagum]|uniref:Thioredoxin n=1 Tax=Chryseobacterium nematophagum TaxID=2305228 RepID=A0A3M7L9I2_9FLAO|nr:thioredoxin-like domain-containing protein [Chryseobacterium nematophagum]RMZ59418.1 thioredoxin [Chryseobacterium nematophagum]